MVYSCHMTSPVFNPADVRQIKSLAEDRYHQYPSSRSLYDAVQTFGADDPPAQYLNVYVGAGPYHGETSTGALVRKDMVDAFVRHLVNDEQIHTIKVERVRVFLRPEGACGLDESALAQALA